MSDRPLNKQCLALPCLRRSPYFQVPIAASLRSPFHYSISGRVCRLAENRSSQSPLQFPICDDTNWMTVTPEQHGLLQDSVGEACAFAQRLEEKHNSTFDTTILQRSHLGDLDDSIQIAKRHSP